MGKKIHINKLKINNPFGLGSYCNEGRNITEWKSKKTNEEYKIIKDNIVKENWEVLTFKTWKLTKKWLEQQRRCK